MRELDERVAQRRQINLLSLPQIVEYSQGSERRYLVMEEVPGRSLGDCCATIRIAGGDN